MTFDITTRNFTPATEQPQAQAHNPAFVIAGLEEIKTT